MDAVVENNHAGTVSDGARTTRVAIVTGAASGIGRATARQLRGDGFALACLDRDADGLERLSQEFGSSEWFLGHAVDLRDRPAASSAVDAVLSHFSGIDVLVNNAGIGVAANVGQTSDEDWDAVIDVNLSAMFRLTRAALPSLLRERAGVVVNVSSVAGVVGVRERAAYCASKAGVLGLTRALAVDYAAQGLRANAVCPGTVDTEWIGKILSGADDPAGKRAQMESRQLDGRMGTPEEVAATIAFLAGPKSRFANGAAWLLDGGMTAV